MHLHHREALDSDNRRPELTHTRRNHLKPDLEKQLADTATLTTRRHTSAKPACITTANSCQRAAERHRASRSDLHAALTATDGRRCHKNSRGRRPGAQPPPARTKAR